MANNPNAIVAKLHNQASYEEGEADAALEPGQGCVIYEDADGNKHVRAAGADEQTTRVVREARNMPRGLGVEGESPLSQTYDLADHVETVGFNRFDQARCQIVYETDANGDDIVPDSGDPVGWDAGGNLSAAAADFVARVRETYTVDGVDFTTVEFF